MSSLPERSAGRTDAHAAAVDAAQFDALMQRLGPFEDSPQLAVAVSGGADSMALALLAAEWSSGRGGAVVALTVDHGLRPESAAEARQVRRWLAARNIRHHILAWRGGRPTGDVQAAAREARYRLLAQWCARHGILHLLLAHHRDDQAETLMLRLARGTGMDGLAAMAPISHAAFETEDGPVGLRLLRPFLGLPKSALEATLREAGQGWIEDPSNDDPGYGRVRIRRLMPLLAAEGMSPQRLAATAAHIGRARAALEAAVSRLAAEAAALHPAGYLTLRLGPYRTAPAETALRCLARALATIGGTDYPPRFEGLERLHAELVDPAAWNTQRGRTLGGCRIVPVGDTALICREPAAATAEVTLRAGRTVWWDGRFLIRARGAGTARVAALGAAGWRVLLHNSKDYRHAAIASPARPTLPALWDRSGLLEVPHLGYRRPGAAGPRVSAIEFAPRRPLAPAGFMVV